MKQEPFYFLCLPRHKAQSCDIKMDIIYPVMNKGGSLGYNITAAEGVWRQKSSNFMGYALLSMWIIHLWLSLADFPWTMYYQDSGGDQPL